MPKIDLVPERHRALDRIGDTVLGRTTMFPLCYYKG
jgi:hypothetical protein